MIRKTNRIFPMKQITVSRQIIHMSSTATSCCLPASQPPNQPRPTATFYKSDMQLPPYETETGADTRGTSWDGTTGNRTEGISEGGVGKKLSFSKSKFELVWSLATLLFVGTCVVFRAEDWKPIFPSTWDWELLDIHTEVEGLDWCCRELLLLLLLS